MKGIDGLQRTEGTQIYEPSYR